jgi:hypothetical protein
MMDLPGSNSLLPERSLLPSENERDAFIEHVCRLLNDGRPEAVAVMIACQEVYRRHPERFDLVTITLADATWPEVIAAARARSPEVIA